MVVNIRLPNDLFLHSPNVYLLSKIALLLVATTVIEEIQTEEFDNKHVRYLHCTGNMLLSGHLRKPKDVNQGLVKQEARQELVQQEVQEAMRKRWLKSKTISSLIKNTVRFGC